MNVETGYLVDWIGFRLSRNEEPFLMLDPFISYKEEIRNYLQGLERNDAGVNLSIEKPRGS